MDFLLELASVVTTNDKNLHFICYNHSNIKPKIHIAMTFFFEGYQGPHRNTILVAFKKSMLKYVGSHRGKGQHTPQKRLHCTFSTYILQSTNIPKSTNNYAILNQSTHSKPYLKHILKCQVSKLYSKYVNHTLQLKLPFELQRVATTSI